MARDTASPAKGVLLTAALLLLALAVLLSFAPPSRPRHAWHPPARAAMDRPRGSSSPMLSPADRSTVWILVAMCVGAEIGDDVTTFAMKLDP